ncbi:MAG: 23S rRNA (guanosine(2251)-2'-O)-methyltransferase RlmB [Deltaproteobacteria bacterium]|nr:23S rRNA (guanosine(2251)-2'-O)-methyltransferase RlmB [bacterium]MCB9477278.1 23S rRNA (guanosine(2251)-2'-O)-methyltransferase RlmB [Deltaproteobacteria bacterium]MCB9478744.1 23S rRNA (guanosine(2251)-2'-O)-methyltransferase RlmB [Deltaproteobacteria bacterium]MCB9488260.1 23S rRNA (guanosine(2251)-2'-O)-methyltransferase RlmB [Deltaproteobacteria bacterium]
MTRCIFGKHAVEAALKSDHTKVEKVLLDNERPKLSQWISDVAMGIELNLEWTGRHVLDEMTRGGNHQGVAAVLAPFRYAYLEDLMVRPTEHVGGRVAVLLDGVTDPQNLGAVLRSAGAFGADFVVIPQDRAASVNAVVTRIASGAADLVPVARVKNIARAVEQLRGAGFWCYALEADGDKMVSDVDLTGDVAIVVGSEDRGLRPLVKKKTDAVLRIPGDGPVPSLNVASAAACGLYEVFRQRGASS